MKEFADFSPPPGGKCYCCGVECDEEEWLCPSCDKEHGEILASEETRYYGVPYKHQIWTDEYTMEADEKGFGEVEVTCVNYSTVCFRHLKDGHTVPMRREDFCRWFSFKRTTY